MKFKIFFIAIIANIYALAGVEVSGNKMTISTKNGYITSAKIYNASSKTTKDNKVFIVLHGKSSAPNKSHYIELYEDLNDNGYKVIAPKMPWSKDWSGTFGEGLEVVSEIIKSINSNGNKAILLGHSLGGASSLIYSAKYQIDGLLGVITIAPGHMIHNSKKMKKASKKSVEKAREKVDNGDADSKYDFKEINTGKVKDVRMSAKIYLSYYDLEEFPNVQDLFEEVKYPVLWIAGKNDRLTKVYRMSDLFEYLSDNDKHEYIEIKGKHKSVIKNSDKSIINWIEKL